MFKKARGDRQQGDRSQYPVSQDHFPVLSAPMLLTGKRIKAILKHLPVLANAPEKYYDALYLRAIDNFAEFVQGLPAFRHEHYAHHLGMLQLGIERAYATLTNYRKEFPVDNIKPEKMPKKLAQWSYALFTAALLHGIGEIVATYWVYICDEQGKHGERWLPLSNPMSVQGTHYRYSFESVTYDSLAARTGIILASRLLPKDGFNWIAEDKELLGYWLSIIDEDESGSGIFHKMIPPREHQLITNPPEIPGMLGQTGGRQISFEIHQDRNKKSSETTKQKPTNEGLITSSKKPDLVLTPGLSPFAFSPDQLIGTVAWEMGELFLNWIKLGILGQTIHVNRASSKILVSQDGRIKLQASIIQDFLKQNPNIKQSPQEVAKQLAKEGYVTIERNKASASKQGMSSLRTKLAVPSSKKQGPQHNLVINDPTLIYHTQNLPKLASSSQTAGTYIGNNYPKLSAAKVPAAHKSISPTASKERT